MSLDPQLQKMRLLLDYCNKVGDDKSAVEFAREIICHVPRNMSQETLVLSLNMSLQALLESIIFRVDEYFESKSKSNS